MPVGKIVAIMESEPLGLRLRFVGKGDEQFVDLADTCTISRQGAVLTPGDLRVGLTVSIDQRGQVAEKILVLS